MIDFIVVGQGLAGSLLGYFLEERNQKIVIIDHSHHESSTAIAAGVMNPITGRRFVKSWMYDKLLPMALSTYKKLERSYSITLIRKMNIIRLFGNQKAENDWYARRSQKGYEDYLLDKPSLGEIERTINHQGLAGEVHGSYQIMVGQLINCMASSWLKRGTLRREPFYHSKLKCQAQSIQYDEIQARGIIFCEGHQLFQNPLFQSYPLLNRSKGELLIIGIPNFQTERIIKAKQFLIPLNDSDYWFGAVDSWNFSDSDPTAAAAQTLSRKADQMIRMPFSILDHQSAIRPTVSDRRPIFGTHPSLPMVHLFNGLGTKGASLGPYWAHQMTSYILDGQPLLSTVSINRFIN